MSLTAQGISKHYVREASEQNQFAAVETLDLELPKGKLIEISGQSGSGKSTLLNILAGLLKPDTGSVCFEGLDIYRLDDAALSRLRNDHFGVVPQTPSILSSLNVADNVRLPLALYGKKDEDHRTKALLEMLNIMDLAFSMPTKLSGGEIRRVAIARALICKPDIIFADEPTSNLDDDNTQAVLNCLKRVSEQGTTVLLVTHDSAADGYADVALHMNQGVLSTR